MTSDQRVAAIVLVLVVAQRLGELVVARRNTAALRAEGAFEVGGSHYPLIVAVHAAWICGLALWIVLGSPRLSFGWLSLYALLQVARLWAMMSLGRFWTTRIIVVPNAPLIKRGPYKFVRHPNYLVVAGEIAVLPLAFGAISLAIVFTLLNGAALAIRIGVENRALASRAVS